jgi:cyanophycin synthetase
MTAEPITNSTTNTRTKRQQTARRRAKSERGAELRRMQSPAPTMQILDARVMRGPSRWSRRPMIRLLVDLGVLELFPSNEIPGFNGRLLAKLPGLLEHSDAIGRRGGLVERLESGTWLGHVAEHVALEFQNLIGHHLTRGKTRSATCEGQYDVLFAYRIESVGLAAGRAAVALVNALVDPTVANPADVDVDAITANLRALADRDGLGPSTQSIVEEADRRDIPVLRLDEANVVQLGWGVNSRRIRATLTDGASSIATDIAQQKDDAARLLERAGLPVPEWDRARSADEAIEIAARLGGTVVIKPVDGNQGRAITIGELTPEQVRVAFDAASGASRRASVIVQRAVPGNDHRLLVVGGKLIACAERVPAHIVGDGSRSIAQLIEDVNRDPRRGKGHTRELTHLNLDARAVAILSEQGYAPADVPDKGLTVLLARTANLSTGGTSVDRTNQVHPEVINVAELAARVVGLDVCGVDIVTTDIARPLSETGGGIVEVNAAPGFRMHTRPTVGRPRNVARAVVAMLFPNRSEGRIPLVAVTGTNGKTTTTRLIGHICAADGRKVGMTTTDGIVVDGWTIKRGDMAGPRSAQIVLSLPTVETAVLETARGGIVREGLGYDYNDVAVVTNLSGDHLGLGGIETIEDLAEVKSVIVEAVPRSGTAVLNADDRLVSAMARQCRGKVAYTSTDLDRDGRGRRRVLRHIESGELGGLVECGAQSDGAGQERIVVRRGQETLLDVPLSDIPITWSGAAWVNVANALQAACAAIAVGVSPADVERGLKMFRGGIDQAPGRLNRISVNGRDVILDYAHNADAMRNLGRVVERLKSGRRVVGLFTTPGDRRQEDKSEVGRLAGEMFDEIVVSEPDLRGREPGDTAALLIATAQRAKSELSGRDLPATWVQDEVEAAREVMRRSRPGDLVVMCVSRVRPVYQALTGGS